MSNTLGALLVIVLLAICTQITRRYFSRARLIAYIHNAVWAVTLLLIATNLIDYTESSAEAWVTLGLGCLAFNAGIWFSTFLSRRRALKQERSTYNKPAFGLVSRRTLLVLAAAYAAAFGLYLFFIHQHFGVLTLLTDPILIRSSTNPSYLELVPLPVRLVLYLGPLLLAVLGFKESMARPLPGWGRILGLGALALTMLALLQRTNLFMGLLLLVALVISRIPADKDRAEHSVKKRASNRIRLTAIVALASVAAFLGFQLIGGALQKNGSQAISTGRVSPVLVESGMTEPFGYLTGGTVALLHLIDSDNEEWPPLKWEGILVVDSNPQLWGARTFSPVMKVVPGVKEWNEIQPFMDVGIWTNVYTWLEPFYRDFRIIGVFVGSALLGGITAFSYLKRSSSVRHYWVQAAFVSIIFLAGFGPKYNDTLFLVQLLVILLLTSPLAHRATAALFAAAKPGRLTGANKSDGREIVQ